MIAPLRQTDDEVNSGARLLARARRAVAASLLREPRLRARRDNLARWRQVLFVVWVIAVTASSAGLFLGWWQIAPY